VIVVPEDHPLAAVSQPTLAQLAEHPIITYSFSFSGPSSLLEVFAKAGVTPNIALTAWDSDVIKAYIRAGFGIGILADLAIDGTEDADLRIRDAAHLFPPHTTWVGFRRGTLLRSYMYEFMTLLAPHLSKRQVQLLEGSESQAEIDAAFKETKVPLRR
jgi:LysR family cys regulon transcriptional activator